MDEFDFLNQRTAENRRINDAQTAFHMICELLALLIAAAVLAILACIDLAPNWLAFTLVLAGTARVSFRLGRFVGGV